MAQQILEFEKQIKSKIDKQTMPNGNVRYRVSQPALLFTPGEKYPDKFDYDLYYGDDEHKAEAVQPMQIGRYHFKEKAIGVVTNFGRRVLNLDASEIELIQPQQNKTAA